MKKLIIITLALITFLLPLGNEVFANSNNISEENTPNITFYSEQFKWYYRDRKGGTQRRLWSMTYGYWVTDWEWIKK